MEASARNGRRVSGLCASLRRILHVCLNFSALLASLDAREFCQFDVMNATCPIGKVVLMTSARYGRFKVGTCGLRDRDIGCGTSVLETLDSKCSGKPSCTYSVPELGQKISPCPRDMTSYLEATYQCLSVIHPGSGVKCNSTVHINEDTPSVYVSNYVAHHHGLAAPQCPVRISASPGQTLNISMYNFQHFLDHSPDTSSNPCPLYAIIKEGNRVTSHDLCKLRSRQQHLNTTQGHSLEIYFHSVKYGRQNPAYIAKIEAVGCADLRPQAGAHIERKGVDGAMVRCNNSQDTWYLTCQGTKWIGTLTNCTLPRIPETDGHVNTQSSHLPFGLLVAITIGVVLGILFGIFMLIMVFVIRKRKRQRKPPRVNTLLGEEHEGSQNDSEDIYCRRVWHDCPHHASTLPASSASGLNSVYSRTPAGYNTHPVPQHICSGDYTQMLELQSNVTSSPNKSTESHYGRQCQRHVKFLDAAPLNLSQPVLSVDPGSFPTFKPRESNYGTAPGSRRPQMPICCSNVDQELYSVGESTSGVSPPDKQPDVVQQGSNGSSNHGRDSNSDSLRNLQNWLQEQSGITQPTDIHALAGESHDNVDASEHVIC